MIVDTSALIAIVFKEPGHEELIHKMSEAEYLGIGTPTLAETGIVLSARLQGGGRTILARLCQELGLVQIPFGDTHWREAVSAYERFGRGRYPARLNFGDSTPCLNAYNPVTVQSGGVTANQGEPLFPNLLVGQIGKRVQSLELRENEALRFIFEDASVIAVSLKSADYIGPEAVNLFQDDGVTVVE